MAVLSLPPYIVATMHKGGREVVPSLSQLRSGTDQTQVFKGPKLIRGVHSFQTTLAQLAGMCKGHCTCLSFLVLVVSFHKEGISVIEPLYVSFDAPIIELPCGLDKVVVHGGQSQ